MRNFLAGSDENNPNPDFENRLLKLLTDLEVGEEMAGIINTLANENVSLAMEDDYGNYASVTIENDGLLVNFSPEIFNDNELAIMALRNETFHVNHLSDTARVVNSPTGFPLTDAQIDEVVKRDFNLNIELASSVAQIKEPNVPLTFTNFYDAIPTIL
jgi:hypothetical protein